MPRRLLCTLPLLLAACAADEGAYYARLETDLRSAGFMRTETAPRDAAFTNADLVRHFERVALFSEYGRENDRFVQRREQTILSKWQDPIRIRLVFGESVPEPQRLVDHAQVASFVSRLARLSGLEMRVLTPQSRESSNFVIIYANRPERREIAAQLAATSEDPDPAFINSLSNSPTNEICYVNTFWHPEERGRFAFAVTVIKSETAGLMRLACVHEELSQALGLGNDDDEVRPSIFNDDEEFALLTEHDEYLLRMLYDDRLRPGMTAEEVRPLLPAIIADIRAETGS
ncbi:MAG TPA: DUF2927 domain-containing protein [Paracoccaceae bacterium]|nr:DUF2927 domain-containing protein [Paracoccaceae bacterium]